MGDDVSLPRSGGIRALFSTFWGRLLVLVGAGNLLWFLWAQSFISSYQIAEDVFDWLRMSILISMPMIFVFGWTFVSGTARLRRLSIAGFVSTVCVAFIASEFELVSDLLEYGEFYQYNSERLLGTFAGPIFALMFAFITLFGARALEDAESGVSAEKTAPPSKARLSGWGGTGLHVIALVLALALSNFANGFLSGFLGLILSSRQGEPDTSNDMVNAVFLSALLLCSCQVVFFGLIYKLFNRIDAIKVIPILVVVSLISVAMIYYNSYAELREAGWEIDTATYYSSVFGALQALSQSVFIVMFYLMFRNRKFAGDTAFVANN